MPDHFELAPSGRSRCRACQKTIPKGELRFAASFPNPFGEGETNHYFHLECGAFCLPEAYLAARETAAAGDDPLASLEPEQRQQLAARAELSRDHHRLRRFASVERAKTARAHCRHCRETIDKGELRFALSILEEGRSDAAGFVHLRCARPYAGPVESLLGRLPRPSDFDDDAWAVVEAALEPPASK